jgi:hypothetical protein
MFYIINVELSSYKEVAFDQVGQDAMVEYNSIMKNDVWEIVPRLKGKSMVDSR